MALSLAACGGSDSTTTAVVADPVTPVTPVTPTGATFDLTPLVDIASGTQALNGSLSSTFRFTDGNETINGMTATMASTDTLLDPSTTDADVLNVTITGATTATTVNIETINLTYSVADQTFTGANSGTTAYNVSGTVAGKLESAASGATINVNDYGRVLEVKELVLTGTTASGSAETLDIALSGATHGATAAAQTGVTLIGASGSTSENLETLNIASNGSAANTFTLAAGNSETIGTVVTSGANELTIRADEAMLDGKTIDATGSTADVNVSFATGSGITTSAANWSGVDSVIYRDADSTAGAATLNSAASGQNVEVANSVSTLTVAAKGAAYNSFAASASLQLNGTSTTAGVTVDKYIAQNTTTLNLASEGLASSTSTTAANTISDLEGDFSTITITGDTSLKITALDIDDVATATSATTARAVTVDASAMTGNAFVNITAGDDAKVSYTMTGTDGADTLIANESGNTLNGGAGKDTLTGGNGADTIDGGAANDHIDTSYGADKITGGAGNDTFDVEVLAADASAQVTTFTNLATYTHSGTVADTLTITIDGQAFTHQINAAGASSDIAAAASATQAVAALKATVLNATGVTLTVDGSDTDLVVATGNADGTAFTMTANWVDDSTNGDPSAAITVSTTAGAAALDAATTITDFAAGDIIDTVTLSDLVVGAYYEGTTAAISASGTTATANAIHVLTTEYASAELAEDAISAEYDTIVGADDGIFIFLNTTSGVAEAYYDIDLENDPSANALTDINQILTFENITNTTDLAAAFSSDSFVI